jgi:hypothetical protein
MQLLAAITPDENEVLVTLLGNASHAMAKNPGAWPGSIFYDAMRDMWAGWSSIPIDYEAYNRPAYSPPF